MARQTRKQMKHDEFVETTVSVVQRIQDNPRPYVMGVAGVLVLVVAAWALMYFSASSRNAAADRFAQGLAAFEDCLRSTQVVKPPMCPARPILILRTSYDSIQLRRIFDLTLHSITRGELVLNPDEVGWLLRQPFEFFVDGPGDIDLALRKQIVRKSQAVDRRGYMDRSWWRRDLGIHFSWLRQTNGFL